MKGVDEPLGDFVVFGRVKFPYVRARSVQVTGVVVAALIVADEEVIIAGSGRVGVLASNTCVLVSGKRPIIIERAHCVNIVALGTKAPIVLRWVRAARVYARKAIIGELEAREVVLAELCNVKSLLRVSRVVFADPHVYIEDVSELGEVVYSYKLPEESK